MRKLYQAFNLLFGRVRLKKSEKSFLLTGLRGVGKTVLLNEIERKAKKHEYLTSFIEIHEGKNFASILIPELRRLLFEIVRVAGVGDKVRRGLGVLKSFINSITITMDDINFGIDIDLERGIADSGDLEIDLTALFIALGEAAEERKFILLFS